MELTIDTASPLTGLALTERGAPLASYNWFSGRNQAAELLPALERLLAGARVDRTAIDAIFVNRGPGGYGGLRVGISTALALAFAVGADLLGYGRLEADAYPLLQTGRPVCAIHDAGRDEFAWAIYQHDRGQIREIHPPSIGPAEAAVDTLPGSAFVVGETARLTVAVPEGVVILDGGGWCRVASGAALAWDHYAAGARDSHLALTPIYLREPNITAPRGSRRDATAPA